MDISERAGVNSTGHEDTVALALEKHDSARLMLGSVSVIESCMHENKVFESSRP